MTTITSEMLLSINYAASPNNIHGLPGSEWNGASAGMACTKHSEHIRLIDGKLSIWTTKYYKRPDGSGFMFSISGIVTELSNIDEMIAYCNKSGKKTAALPAYANSWD